MTDDLEQVRALALSMGDDLADPSRPLRADGTPYPHVGGYAADGSHPASGAGPDLSALIAQQVQQQLGQMGHLAQAAPQSFEDVLEAVDPADSEAALSMLDWLLRNDRLHRVGVLDGGQGYLFVYQEPKGSTKQGYRPGATQGDRIVDEAVDQQRASGNQPVRQSMCTKCMAVVGEVGGQVIDVDGGTECPGGGEHVPA